MVSAEGILFIIGTVFTCTNTGESLFTLIFCLPLTYQIVSEKFCFKIPKIYKKCVKQFLQRAETWRNCWDYRSFLIFEPNLQVYNLYLHVLWTYLFANKQKCLQWPQHWFAYCRSISTLSVYKSSSKAEWSECCTWNLAVLYLMNFHIRINYYY